LIPNLAEHSATGDSVSTKRSTIMKSVRRGIAKLALTLTLAVAALWLTSSPARAWQGHGGGHAGFGAAGHVNHHGHHPHYGGYGSIVGGYYPYGGYDWSYGNYSGLGVFNVNAAYGPYGYGVFDGNPANGPYGYGVFNVNPASGSSFGVFSPYGGGWSAGQTTTYNFGNFSNLFP
jgi:hypothetical protein